MSKNLGDTIRRTLNRKVSDPLFDAIDRNTWPRVAMQVRSDFSNALSVHVRFQVAEKVSECVEITVYETPDFLIE